MDFWGPAGPPPPPPLHPPAPLQRQNAWWADPYRNFSEEIKKRSIPYDKLEPGHIYIKADGSSPPTIYKFDHIKNPSGNNGIPRIYGYIWVDNKWEFVGSSPHSFMYFSMSDPLGKNLRKGPYPAEGVIEGPHLEKYNESALKRNIKEVAWNRRSPLVGFYNIKRYGPLVPKTRRSRSHRVKRTRRTRR